MKTKIIYVLVSNENDCYLEQALVSIYSLRLYNPDANLLLLVDEETSRTLENGIRKLILNYVSKLVIVDVPFHYSKQQKSRYMYLQPIITQYFIDNKSEIWLLFLIAHSKR